MTQLIFPVLIAFVASLALGPILIPALQKLKFGQVVRDDGPQSHLKKTGTPTMGGFMIIISTVIACVILIRGYDPHVAMAAFSFIGFGIIGFIDDMIKISSKNSGGLKARQKIVMQFIIAVVLAVYTYQHVGTSIKIPFSDAEWDLGFWIIPVVIFMVIGITNSTNLTDGLDGLLSGVSLVYFAAYALIFLAGILPSGNNLLIMCGALVGACLGFLRFNAFPARLFMGDTGSLAIGGMVVFVGIVTKTLLWFPIMGLMFAVASISVIIQVTSYKLRKKRVFKMAPLHHHFELKGYHEVTVVSMYMIITVILCLVGILALN